MNLMDLLNCWAFCDKLGLDEQKEKITGIVDNLISAIDFDVKMKLDAAKNQDCDYEK